MAIGLGADVQGHADALAGVVAGAAHLGEVPVGAEVACPPLGIRLEAAGRDHHRARGEIAKAGGRPHLDAGHAPRVVLEEAMRRVRVAHLDAGGLRAVEEHLDQPGPAAHRLHVQPAPEAVLTAHLVRLPAVHEDPADAPLAHPRHRAARAADQVLGEVGVGEPLRDAEEIVAELGLGVGRHLDGRRLLVREIREDVATEVGQPLVGEAETARGEKRVAPAFMLRGLLEDENGGAALARGECRAERGIAAADHDDVGPTGDLHG